MDKQIKILRKVWKTGSVALIVSTLFLGGLVLNLRTAFATNPNLTLLYLGINNTTGGSWEHNVNVSSGQQIKFYAEIHNTNVPSTANNVKIKVTLPNGSGTSTATVSADNNGAVSDNVAINVSGGGQLQYVPGSTKVTWDVDGDGNLEFDDTVMPDGIVGSGIVLGNQQGCNQYIIQLSFKVNVVAAPSPSPQPSPTPAPPAGGQNQEQNQSQTQNNNQSVNITNTNTNTVNVPEVKGVSVPLKQPETGVSVLGLASMLGAGPVGIALSRFGRGRSVISKREEENLAELASNLVEDRIGKSWGA